MSLHDDVQNVRGMLAELTSPLAVAHDEYDVEYEARVSSESESESESSAETDVDEYDAGYPETLQALRSTAATPHDVAACAEAQQTARTLPQLVLLLKKACVEAGRNRGGALAAERTRARLMREASTWDLARRVLLKVYPEAWRDRGVDGSQVGTDAAAELFTLSRYEDMRRVAAVVQWLEETRMDEEVERGRLRRGDVRDARALLETVWLFMRCGLLAEASELCVEAGEHRLAAMLQGGALEHAPALSGAAYGDVPACDGNPHRGLWKEMCRRLAADSTSKFERAVFALLGGDVARALTVCSTWEDEMWTRFFILRDTFVDRLPAPCDVVRRGEVVDDVDAEESAVYELRAAVETAVTEVCASEKPAVRLASNDHFRQAQAMLIRDHPDLLLEALPHWLKDLPPDDADVRRFAAHFSILVFEVLPNDELPKPAAESVKKYAEWLSDMNYGAALAVYLAHLAEKDATDMYATFLAHLAFDPAAWRRYYRIGEEVCLVMEAVACLIVDIKLDHYRELNAAAPAHPSPSSAASLASSVTTSTDGPHVPGADDLIEALHWLEHAGPAVYLPRYANRICRQFLLNGHRVKAKDLWDKVDAMQSLGNLTGHVAEDVTFLPQDPELRELVQLRQLVRYEALRREINRLRRAAPAAADDGDELRLRQEAVAAAGFLYVQTRWLHPSPSADPTRERELRAIRRTYVPRAVIYYMKLLTELRRPAEALEAVSRVVAPQGDWVFGTSLLSSEFSRDDAQKMFRRAAEAARMQARDGNGILVPLQRANNDRD